MCDSIWSFFTSMGMDDMFEKKKAFNQTDNNPPSSRFPIKEVWSHFWQKLPKQHVVWTRRDSFDAKVRECGTFSSSLQILVSAGLIFPCFWNAPANAICQTDMLSPRRDVTGSPTPCGLDTVRETWEPGWHLMGRLSFGSGTDPLVTNNYWTQQVTYWPRLWTSDLSVALLSIM